MPADSFDYSPIAERVIGVRDPDLGAERTAFGYLIHTTGGGVTREARKANITPIEWALAYYIRSQNGANGYKWGGPHYVGDFDGKLYQVAPDNVKTAHCGGRSEKYPNGTRQHYITREDSTTITHWTKLIPANVVAEWRKRWPHVRHPYALFPSRDPNADYVGLELIPIGDGFGGEPMAPGLRFTQAQHDAAIKLGIDLRLRHEWPEAWHRTGRLLGHEDVDILNRSDSKGGWDPGSLRPQPYFDFGYVRMGIAQG